MKEGFIELRCNSNQGFSIESVLTTSGIAAIAPTLNKIQENMVKTLTDKGMKADRANEHG